MCGIAGSLTLDGRPSDPEYAEQMIRSLGHRGPDDASLLLDGEVVLGHRRLSIIDVANGQQPMSTADERLWITFNGEIFNYPELREDLAARGHRFSNHSDTEVLLHLYQEYGPDCVHRLNGQWAFAIWDTERRTLFLSRDRLGVRPLFYTKAANTFLFASEIKALFAHSGVERAIDARAVDQFFTFWTALSPRTMFKGVFELPPGHSMTVAAGDIKVQPYWQPTYDASGFAMSEDEAATGLLDLLVDATRVRLRADVPVGAYLSGGLDSTVIAGLIKRFTTTPLRTFSLAFEADEFDESAFQQSAIDYLETDHDSFRCRTSDIGRVFPDVIWHTEKPVLRTAPAPMFLLSKLVRDRGYKVVLTGEGSDEILGGYDIFKEAKIRRFWGRVPHSRMRPALLRRLYPYLKNLQAQPEAYLRAFFRTAPEDFANPFFSHLPRWAVTAQLKVFYSPELRAELRGYDPIDELRGSLPSGFAGWDGFSQAQYLETAHLLPAYILSSQGDRMSMGHSVEGRFPFLDHRVVEFAARLPPRLKMKVLNEKFLLKQAVRGLIPENVRTRKKQPYRAPDAASFFAVDGTPLDYVAALLSENQLQQDGIFNPGAVSRLLTKARSGRELGMKDNMGVVGVLSTQLLINQFIRNFRHDRNADRDTPVRRRQLPVRAAG
ncbi:MAG TPA: asparagine synthase (glutamine-hydrolyzing) [Vicinamibacterales bacterium]|nr:asparagine synthase (glutamine-hydrolyzing) [Vicinamibacterales bacterium]